MSRTSWLRRHSPSKVTSVMNDRPMSPSRFCSGLCHLHATVFLSQAPTIWLVMHVCLQLLLTSCMATICRCGHANHRTKRIYLYRTSSPVHSIESECIRQNSQVRWGQGRLRIESSVMNSSCLTDKWRTKRSSNLERTEPKNAPTLAQELRNQFQSSYRSFPTSRAK